MSRRFESSWVARRQQGNVQVATTTVTVALGPCLLGWTVTERYGPLVRRRWYLTGGAAEQAYHAAEDRAGRYVEASKGSEQEQR